MQKAGARAALLSHGDTLPTAKLKKAKKNIKNEDEDEFHTNRFSLG